MAIRKVGVLGLGIMGSGIAQVCAQAGYDTIARDLTDELVAKGLVSIKNFLNQGVQRGKITQESAAAVLSRIKGTTSIDDLRSCDLLIEAVVEKMDVKKEVLKRIEEICFPQAIFASNTSSLSITEMAAATKRPDRVLGLHFFNPAPLMKLVEVVRTMLTADEVFSEAMQFVRSLGKEPIAAKDQPGFVVNRLLVPAMIDAIRALEEGVASVEDIDKGMTLGAGHPMGPFTLADLVGLDTFYYVANVMYEEYKEKRFAPPPLLKRMVMAGRLGRKSGQGFYKYGS